MRKILNKLSILFIVFILIASPQAICDDIDYEALDVDSEVFTSSSRLEKNITEPDVNSRACVVIDKKTNITKTIKEVHSMRYFFRPELEILLQQAGFELMANIDCNTLEETDYNSWTSYFIAKAK